MKQTRFVQVLVMIALCGFGWALAQEDAVTVEAMKQLEQQWSEFLAANDPAGRAGLYAEDAIWDNINEPPLVGKDEIQALYDDQAQEFIEGGTTTFESSEAVTFGDWGYTSGIWTNQDSEGNISQGHYIHVMRMVDGELKMLRHIYDECGGECLAPE